MTLRIRLATSILLSLIFALTLGGTMAVWRARQSVRIETDAALSGDVQTTQNMLTLRSSSNDGDRLTNLVASFDGQRHVWAVLLDAAGHTVSVSVMARPPEEAPRWFRDLINSSPSSRKFSISGDDPTSQWCLLLQTDSRNEIGEVWGQTRNTFLTIVVLCILIGGLIYFLIIRSLSILAELTKAFSRIAAGNYGVTLPGGTVPDFVTLSDGFNLMTGRLRQYSEENKQLQRQILSLQDEERAEIARDLHDEVGPFLFSINVDAGSIARLAKCGRTDELIDRGSRIREAVDHIQAHVTAILRQLRPVDRLDFGIETALKDLTAFWKLRNPRLKFMLDINSDGFATNRNVVEAAYRVAQESVSNAVRHGHANRVLVELRTEGNYLILQVADDGIGIDPSAPKSGMGLSAMRERVESLHGMLSVENAPGRCGGVLVRARLPIARTIAVEKVMR